MKPPLILVVEDNLITRRMFRVALESQAWSVTEAADAKAAIEAFTRERPDLIVQDLTLPDMDGLDLLKRLVDLPGGTEVPVVATSGFLSKLEQARSLAVGFVEHLFKPVDPFRLIEVVRAHLNAASPMPGNGRSVVVADDDPVQCRLLKLQLEHAGFSVTSANGGQEALDKAIASKPDAIVSDVLMPGMDGFRLCLAVRKDPRLERVPVILASLAFTEEADRRLARSVGANDLVVRGPEHETVVNALLASLSGGEPPAPAIGVEPPAGDYTFRMIRQLERQVGQNAELAGRLALHEAAMGVLARIGATARSPESFDALLPELLNNALDAAGISIGAVYLIVNGGRFVLRAQHGFAAPASLESFFGEGEALERASESGELVNVPARVDEEPWERRLLASAGARSLLLVPLRLGTERLGVLVLAAARRRLAGEWLPFADAIGVQISQAVALARAVSELAEEREKLRQITENLQEVFFMTDRSLTKVHYTSPSYEAIWGRSREALFRDSHAWAEAVHPEDRERTLRDTLAAHERGERYDLTYRIVRPDGGIRWIHARAFPVPGPAGVVERYVGTALDITERKRAEEALGKTEEQLRRAQKMEAIGRLAGGVAHDFNNLLTAIMGYSELILRKLDPSDPIRRDLQEVRKAGERATSLTRQLLVFSRHEVVRPQVLDVNATVSEMERMLHRLIGEDVDLRVTLDRSIGQVKLDKGYLEQVIVNLCVNARDALPRGGKLTIETANVTLSEGAHGVRGDVKPGRYVMLAISDTGTGMTPEVLSHLFEPFFTTKEAGKGTGLGLSTVYGIVEGAGGHIGVYSEVGRGTTFKVYLPRVDEAVTEVASVAHDAATKGTETILLVEDEEMVRTLAKRVLEDQGYSVIAASNGGAALLTCERRTEPIHLLVTDVVMPGMSGPELVERLKALVSDLKVLYTSGYTGGALQHTEALASGRAFLQKPFTPGGLARRVREVLDAKG